MSDRLINIDNLCTNPSNHKTHLCELSKAGKFLEVEKLSENPQHICGNCGKKANSDGALCAPGPFHE